MELADGDVITRAAVQRCHYKEGNDEFKFQIREIEIIITNASLVPW